MKRPKRLTRVQKIAAAKEAQQAEKENKPKRASGVDCKTRYLYKKA